MSVLTAAQEVAIRRSIAAQETALRRAGDEVTQLVKVLRSLQKKRDDLLAGQCSWNVSV